MFGSHQEASCGMQICQHPSCWATNRQAARGLLPAQPESRSLNQYSCGTKTEEEIENILEGLPTVTIFNMLDDYGYDEADITHNPNGVAACSRKYKLTKPAKLQEGVQFIPKLTLKSLASQSVEDVTAPANTPLQSAHGFGDHSDCHSHNKHFGGSLKPVLTETPSTFHNGYVSNKGYKQVQLEIKGINAANRHPKKMLVWCPAPKSKRLNRLKQSYVSQREIASPLKPISLPLQTVPEFKTPAKRHKALRGTVPKKIPASHFMVQEIKAVREVTSIRQTSGVTPQEIAKLRKVPTDALMKVLHQAEEDGIITKGQTNFLLAQVSSKSDKLPSIREINKPMLNDKANQTSEDKIEPKTPFAAKNLKILDADEVRIRSPRTVSVEPVFKMDEEIPPVKESRRTGEAAAIHTTEYRGSKQIASIIIPDRDGRLDASDKEEVDVDDNNYDEKLRDLAEENLRSIGALGKEVSSLKKTPIKYVATVFEENTLPASPIKPFHYSSRTPREMFLRPVVPSSPPTPTERDSLYDAQVGGSTMLVNASSTGPPTIASIIENQSSCSSELKTISSHEIDGRVVRMARTSTSSFSKKRQSPFSSSGGQDGWPQISEREYLQAAESSELAGSPLPSFSDDEIRVISRNESVNSAHDEALLADRIQNLQHGEIRSPAPPPPSPEPISDNGRRTTEPNSPSRAGGAATALGLVTLKNKSECSSNDTAVGSTPTPIVSSIATPQERISTQTPGDTPTIYEVPESTVVDVSQAVNYSLTIAKSEEKSIINTADTFETTLSPNVAKEELEAEIEKLHID